MHPVEPQNDESGTTFFPIFNSADDTVFLIFVGTKSLASKNIFVQCYFVSTGTVSSCKIFSQCFKLSSTDISCKDMIPAQECLLSVG